MLSVVVETHVGTPERYPSMLPPVAAVVVASALVPCPYGMAPVWMFAQPVPPFPTGRTPVTSLARLTRAVATAPAVAFKNPESEPIERFVVKRFVELAVVEKKLVVVAATAVTPPVAFIENKFEFAAFWI